MSMEKRGKFIVFEGIDGAGKTTQLDLLESAFKQAGRKVFRTAEPTESVTGGLLRDALAGNARRSPCELAALFALDRIFHNVNPVNGIQKMLAEGIDVLCDRYYYSSLAYQGSETDYAWVKSMNLNCPEILKPDVCIFLDLTPEESMKRITRGRVTTEIYETLERLTSVRNQFQSVLDDLKATDNVQIINAYAPVEDIHQKIMAALSESGI